MIIVNPYATLQRCNATRNGVSDYRETASEAERGRCGRIGNSTAAVAAAGSVNEGSRAEG